MGGGVRDVGWSFRLGALRSRGTSSVRLRPILPCPIQDVPSRADVERRRSSRGSRSSVAAGERERSSCCASVGAAGCGRPFRHLRTPRHRRAGRFG